MVRNEGELRARPVSSRAGRLVLGIALLVALLIAGAVGGGAWPTTRIAAPTPPVPPPSPAAPAATSAAATPAHNCRIWSSIGSLPEGVLTDQLLAGSTAQTYNLKLLGGGNRDGWGLLYYLPAAFPLPIWGPIVHRGGPSALEDPDYDRAVAEAESLRPETVIAHVRAGTSGHFDLPDPHPFLHAVQHERTVAFAHNGGLSSADTAAVAAYLGDYGDSVRALAYVAGHPGTGPIDSELAFLYLLKFADEHPEYASRSAALAAAVRQYREEINLNPSLNFLFADGDTLYACSLWPNARNPLRYWPAEGDPVAASPYWVVASERMGSQASRWGTIPSGTLAVFAPDAAPRFLYVYPTHSAAEPARRPSPGSRPERAESSGADSPTTPFSGLGSQATPSSASPRQASPSGDPDRSAAPGAALSRAPGTESVARGQPMHNCRFWGLAGRDYPAELIDDHLRWGTNMSLEQLGARDRNPDGWGFGYWPVEAAALGFELPVIRRGRPWATWEPRDGVVARYDRTVAELRLLRPQAVVGHVRNGTTGHFGVPDPHPFRHTLVRDGHETTYLFAHNGTLPVDVLVERLGGYLDETVTDYTAPAANSSGVGYIDSELYFHYLLELIRLRPELDFETALVAAVDSIAGDAELVGPYTRINFLLTDGTTLYALNHYGDTTWDPVMYYPAVEESGPPPPFYVAASESLGSHSGWTALPVKTLAVLEPGAHPRLHSIGAGSPEPGYRLDAVAVFAGEDADGDGASRSVTVCCDPNVDQGTWSVSVALLASASGLHPWESVATSRARMITAAEPDSICLSYFVADTLATTMRDLKLELVAYETGLVVADATPGTHPQLAAIALEGAAADDPGAPPDTTRLAVGQPRPNPTRAGITIPVTVPAGGAAARLEVWDIAGRCIHASDPQPLGAGEQQLAWDGRDREGRRVASGAYYGRVLIAGREWWRDWRIIR